MAFGGFGGSAASMNKSIKDNSSLKGNRTHYFKLRKKYKTVYSKQKDKNADKMTPEQFQEFRKKLAKAKRRKTITNIITILIFIGVLIFGFVYLSSIM